MTIEWHKITQSYNRRHNKSLSEKDLLKAAYKHFGTVGKTADYFKVSYPSMRRRLEYYDIPVSHPVGGGNPGKGKETLVQKLLSIPPDEIARLTTRELREQLGCRSPKHFQYLLHTHNLAPKRKRITPSPISDAILAIPPAQVKNMTIDQICQATGAAKRYAYIIVSRNNINYKRYAFTGKRPCRPKP